VVEMQKYNERLKRLHCQLVHLKIEDWLKILEKAEGSLVLGTARRDHEAGSEGKPRGGSFGDHKPGKHRYKKKPTILEEAGSYSVGASFVSIYKQVRARVK